MANVRNKKILKDYLLGNLLVFMMNRNKKNIDL